MSDTEEKGTALTPPHQRERGRRVCSQEGPSSEEARQPVGSANACRRLTDAPGHGRLPRDAGTNAAVWQSLSYIRIYITKFLPLTVYKRISWSISLTLIAKKTDHNPSF